MSLLRIVDIHTYYGKSYILQGASLEVKSGEVVALLGRNGAGKTTTLKTVMGLVKPKAGKVLFRDTDITPFPAFKIAREGIGYVPQGRQLFPKMTVLENLRTGMRGLGDESRKEQLSAVFSLFPNLEPRLGQLAGTLSGGEQQALAISRALVTRPDILLLDEPTTGLMPIFVSKLKDIIKTLNDRGMSILLVEEKIPFALSAAHRVYFMVKGKIEYGAEKESVQGKKEIIIRYLGVEA